MPCTQFREWPHTPRKNHWWPYSDDHNADNALRGPLKYGPQLSIIIILFAEQLHAALQQAPPDTLWRYGDAGARLRFDGNFPDNTGAHREEAVAPEKPK